MRAVVAVRALLVLCVPLTVHPTLRVRALPLNLTNCRTAARAQLLQEAADVRPLTRARDTHGAALLAMGSETPPKEIPVSTDRGLAASSGTVEGNTTAEVAGLAIRRAVDSGSRIVASDLLGAERSVEHIRGASAAEPL